MIRVLHVVTSMDMGGLENRIMDIYRHIDRNVVQFDFLVHRNVKGFFDDEIENMGGKIFRICKLTPATMIFQYNNVLKCFFKEHQEYKIVHAHLNSLSFYVLRAAQRAQIPVRIAHSRTSGLKLDTKYFIKLFAKYRIKKYATNLFACSDDAGKWLFGHKQFALGSIDIINNAIEADKYIYDKIKRDIIRDNLNLSNKFVVGHVGSMRYEKNHMFIIDIFSEILKQVDNSILILVGDGPLRDKVNEKISKLNLTDKVIFTGIRTDVNILMQAFDVFLFPSIFEGFGTVLVEAQASGLKCFTSTKVPRYTNITNLVTFMNLDRSPKEWAKEIVQSSLNYYRENTINKVISAGFEINNVAKDLQNKYMRLGENIDK